VGRIGQDLQKGRKWEEGSTVSVRGDGGAKRAGGLGETLGQVGRNEMKCIRGGATRSGRSHGPHEWGVEMMIHRVNQAGRVGRERGGRWGKKGERSPQWGLERVKKAGPESVERGLGGEIEWSRRGDGDSGGEKSIVPVGL
jgi:hypothetical protein